LAPKDYVALDATVDEISRAITFLGFEVEIGATTGAPPLEHVVVGEILTRAQAPQRGQALRLHRGRGSRRRGEEHCLRRAQLRRRQPRAGRASRVPCCREFRHQALEDPRPGVAGDDVFARTKSAWRRTQRLLLLLDGSRRWAQPMSEVLPDG
jgi:hypothetical protein